MLIPEHVARLNAHYQQYMPLIREFVQDALAIVDAQGLTELWIEQYEEEGIGITPIKNGRCGHMTWAPNIEHFDEILAYLRSPEIQCFKVPNESIGRIDGIRFSWDDIKKLQQLLDVWDS